MVSFMNPMEVIIIIIHLISINNKMKFDEIGRWLMSLCLSLLRLVHFFVPYPLEIMTIFLQKKLFLQNEYVDGMIAFVTSVKYWRKVQHCITVWNLEVLKFWNLICSYPSFIYINCLKSTTSFGASSGSISNFSFTFSTYFDFIPIYQ